MNTVQNIVDAFATSQSNLTMNDMPSSGLRFTPPNGDYLALVTKIEVGNKTFSKTEKTVTFVRFHYTILEGDLEQMTVQSDDYILDNSTPPTPGAKMAREISMRRLHRNLQVLAGRPFRKDENLQDILMEVAEKLDEEKTVSVTFKSNTDKKGYPHLDDAIRNVI